MVHRANCTWPEVSEKKTLQNKENATKKYFTTVLLPSKYAILSINIYMYIHSFTEIVFSQFKKNVLQPDLDILTNIPKLPILTMFSMIT